MNKYIKNPSNIQNLGEGQRLYGRGEIRSISTQNDYNTSKYFMKITNKDDINGLSNYRSKNKENTNINEAFQIIQEEFRQKDLRILELEKKVAELKEQIEIAKLNQSNNNKEENDLIENSNKFEGKNYNKTPETNLPNKNLIIGNKNYVGHYKNANVNINRNSNINNNAILRESNGIQNKNNNNNFTGNIKNVGNNNNNYLRGYQNYNKKDDKKININSKLHYESDNEKVFQRKITPTLGVEYNNDTLGVTGNSFLTNNEIPSKYEVKTYLKEVRSRVNPLVFKQFIENIKLLTDKNCKGINKQNLIRNVKMLFGNEYEDLFEKFETILGIKNTE